MAGWPLLTAPAGARSPHGWQLALALGLADLGLNEVGVEPVLEGNLGNRGVALQACRDDLGLERQGVATAASDLTFGA